MHAGSSLTMPALIGNYVIERELGRGGMGAVYAGTHQLIGKRAAIKVLLPQLSQREDLVERFFREARAATAINHPGIVEVHDYGIGPDGNAFLVMEYLEGESLAARMKSHGRLSVPVAVSFARQIALALAAAHRAGIVHRDLKPDNVFLLADPDGNGERIKLLDFGVAKLVDEAGTAGSVTTTGAILGTPQYMSPEQCEGSRVVDHRSDLYSLGCTLFLMLTGRLPFMETGIGGLIGAHLHMPAPELREHCHTASPQLAAIVARLLAKAPEDRFQTADELVTAFAEPAARTALAAEPIAQTPVAVSDARTEATLAVPTKRRRVWPWLVLAAVIAGGIVTAMMTLGRTEPTVSTATVDSTPREKVEPKPIPVIQPTVVQPTVVQPSKPVSLAQAHLAFVYEALKKSNYKAAGQELEKLYVANKAAPDPDAMRAVEEIKTEHAAPAIKAALSRIAILVKANACKLASTDAKSTQVAWGPAAALDRAAAQCKSGIEPFDSNTKKPPPSDPVGNDIPSAIQKAFASDNYKEVVNLCIRQPPGTYPKRPELYTSCIVSACHLKNGGLALKWIRRKRPSLDEHKAISRALNQCWTETRLHLLELDPKKPNNQVDPVFQEPLKQRS